MICGKTTCFGVCLCDIIILYKRNETVFGDGGKKQF